MRLIFLILLLPSALSAQKIEIIRKTDSIFKKINPDAVFLLIDSPGDRPEIRFVATIRASMSKGNMAIGDVVQMRDKIEKKAKEIGANSYFVRDYVLNDSSKLVRLVLDVYRSSASITPSAKKGETQNLLYLFPTFTGYNKKLFTFKFNEETIGLAYREYFVCTLEAGNITKIRKALAEKTISVNSDMQDIALAYVPFNPFMNETGKFNELPADFLKLYFRTFFIHPKTCTGCVIPPAATPSPSAPQ